MNDAPQSPSDIALDLTLASESLVCFFPTLQRGFAFRTTVNRTVKDVLCDALEVSSDYIEDNIKTIFLDGKPVDDVNAAMATDGAVLALSAAMPGLVGATMRRGGVLASFRNTISYRSEKGAAGPRDGGVVFKLFNLLTKALGPVLLNKGIRISRAEAADLLRDNRETFQKHARSVALDGRETDMDALSAEGLPGDRETVRLRVRLT